MISSHSLGEGFRERSTDVHFCVSKMLLGKLMTLSFTSQHLVCCGSTQRGQALSSQCLLKTSPESSWHRQDTAALSTCTRLSLSPWSFFHSHLFLPHSLCLSLSLSLLSSHHLVLPCLSIRVTSLLLLIFLSCPVLSHSLASVCSQHSAVANTWWLCRGPLFAVILIIILFVMFGVFMRFWAL